jgi:hypothetical protein
MTEETKRAWDVVLAVITMAGATIAFALSLYQWRKGQEWSRAAKGRELIDILLDSDDSDNESYTWDAMRMLDYQDETRPFRTKTIADKRYNVTRKLIKDALTSDAANTDEFIYVRECFDELYFRLGQLQDAIDNKLVKLKHVCCPVDYYAGVMAKDVKLHYDYMRDFHYEKAMKFLENFKDWRKARIAAELPLIAER